MGEGHSTVQAYSSRPVVLLAGLIVLFLALSGCGSGKSGGAVNIPPVANAVCEKTSLNANLTGDLNTNVTDPDSTVLGFSLVADGLKGSATIDPTGSFTYVPNFGARGIDSFFYQVDDLEGGQDTAAFTVIIENTRIMPLGDSITVGSSCSVSPKIGYRQKLYNDLVAGGYTIDFVGSKTDGAFADPDHEGTSGATAADIATNVITHLSTNPADVVLLHIGTNDLAVTSVGDAINNLAAVLDAIDTWEASNNSSVTVLLARIIDQNPLSAAVTAFNQGLVSLVQTRIASGDKIVSVNQRDALAYPVDLCDSLHPTSTGYAKMADVWFAQLTNPANCFVKN